MLTDEQSREEQDTTDDMDAHDENDQEEEQSLSGKAEVHQFFSHAANLPIIL